MPAPRQLPDPDEIRRMLERGKTQQQIADEYGTTKQAVSYHVRGRNLRPAPPRYDAYVPWQLRPEHRNSHTIHMLRAYARRTNGLELNPVEAKRLEGFIRRLEKLDAVVDYAPDDYEAGFALVPRRHGVDKGLIYEPLVLDR